MLKSKVSIFLMVSLILAFIIPIFITSVSSSSGAITINSKTASSPTPSIQAGQDVNLYLGEVEWDGTQVALLLSPNNSPSDSSGNLYTPNISVYDVESTTAAQTYSNNNGDWITGYGWINGSIPPTTGGGNYYIKAVDQIGGNVAVTDTYIAVIPLVYDSTLIVTPSSGPGGVPIVFMGTGYLVGQSVTISYHDPTIGDWHVLTTTTANDTGGVYVASEAPDLKNSIRNYDSSEMYSEISYRSEQSGRICSYASYDEYYRGLKTVGSHTSYGLLGNGTYLSDVRVQVGDTIPIEGMWFHSSDPIYIRWDGINVVDTVTHDQWLSANIIGSTIASANGSFSTFVTIPNANAGQHYLAIEDSQTWIVVKIFVNTASLQLNPSSGPGGATVQFTGSGYPASTSVTLSYLGTFGWATWTSTSSNSNGEISISTEIPDLLLSGRNEFGNASSMLSFRTEVDAIPYSYVDYTQFYRGLSRVGNQLPYNYGLYGNGTDLSSSVNVTPGDSLVISGSWFHPGVVYVRFDGTPVVDTITRSQWLNAQIISTTSASSTGSFSTTVTIPTASGGEHYISVEDFQTWIVFKLKVVAPSITPTPAPTASPTTNPTPTPRPTMPAPIIDLSCRSTDSNDPKVEISGSLTLNGNPLTDTSVLISYSVTGGNTWESLTLVRTISDGSFSAVWTPEVTGNYLVKATVQETSTMDGAFKTINLAITPPDPQNPDENRFMINSNSTIRQFAFDPDTKELSFTVEGSSNSTGYVDVYIPKAIFSDISTLKAYIDGDEVSFNSESVGDSWLISFTYHHSTHRITMELGSASQPITETSDMQWAIYATAVAVIVVVALLVVVTLKRRSR